MKQTAYSGFHSEKKNFHLMIKTMKNIDRYNVRIVQNGELIQDQLYDIYDPLTMAFEENEGFYFHKDYNEVIKKEHEYRSPLFPTRNHSIVESDYYSVSVSLKIYLKMLSGKMPFPFKCNLKERIDYDLWSYCLISKPPKKLKDFINHYKKKLSKV